MLDGVLGVVPAAADVAADEADPEVVGCCAGGALGPVAHLLEEGVAAEAEGGEAADRAAGVLPLVEAAAVEGVLAGDGDEPCGLCVHALEAHWAGGQFYLGGIIRCGGSEGVAEQVREGGSVLLRWEAVV